MKLTTSIVNNILMLSDLIVMTIAYIILVYYITAFDISLIIIITVPYFIIFILPVICIHLNYLLKSPYKSIFINISCIKIEVNNNFTTIEEDEIKVINYYMSASRQKKSALRNFPFEDYYYTEIILKNDERIFITCLYSIKIDSILKETFSNTIHKDIRTFYPLLMK